MSWKWLIYCSTLMWLGITVSSIFPAYHQMYGSCCQESTLWISRSWKAGGICWRFLAAERAAHIQPRLQLQRQHVLCWRLRVRGACRAEPPTSHHLHRTPVARWHRSVPASWRSFMQEKLSLYLHPVSSFCVLAWLSSFNRFRWEVALRLLVLQAKRDVPCRYTKVLGERSIQERLLQQSADQQDFRQMCGYVCKGNRSVCRPSNCYVMSRCFLIYLFFLLLCCGISGVLQTLPRRLQGRGRACLRVTLLCQVQVLQEDQVVDHALELGSLYPKRSASARCTGSVYICRERRREGREKRGTHRNYRRNQSDRM